MSLRSFTGDNQNGRENDACDDKDQNIIQDHEYKPGFLYKIVFRIFYILCLLTGQLTFKPVSCNQKTVTVVSIILTFFMTFIFLLVNIFSLIFNFYIIVWCPYEHCGYISIKPFINITVAKNVQYLRDMNPDLTKYYDWQKAVLTTATISGTFSYLFMVYSLYSQHGCLKQYIFDPIRTRITMIWEYCGEEPTHDSSAGDHQSLQDDNSEFEEPQCDFFSGLRGPFDDSMHSMTSTILYPRQSTYFMLIFMFNIMMYGGNVALLYVIFHIRVDRQKKKSAYVDAAGIAFQFVSQLCAIFSCFIFSKVAYAVGNTCIYKLPKLFDKVNNIDFSKNNNRSLKFLRDKHYISQSDICLLYTSDAADE